MIVDKDGRRILFQGISNCRDLGGLMTADGHRIKDGLLLRSARLTDATEDDVKELREVYHLSEILDLRNADEQEEKPDRPVPGAVHVDMRIIEWEQTGITHEEDESLPPYERWPDMGELYVHFITLKPLNRNLARAVHRVLTHDYDQGAVLWHCFGGKDRCGLVAALILSVLGVPYEVVKEDYMMTNIVASPIAERELEKVRRRGGSQREADFIYNANIAKESFLDGAFAALRERFGDAASFLREMDNVTSEEIEAFKQRVTATKYLNINKH